MPLLDMLLALLAAPVSVAAAARTTELVAGCPSEACDPGRTGADLNPRGATVAHSHFPNFPAAGPARKLATPGSCWRKQHEAAAELYAWIVL